MSAPALPRRVPGAVLAASAAEDCSADVDVCHVCNGVHLGGAGGAFCEAAGDVFTMTLPTVEGPPPCFECERHPARLLVTTTETGYLGGQSSSTFKICEHCVGHVAVSLPIDVAVVITRLRKDPS